MSPSPSLSTILPPLSAHHLPRLPSLYIIHPIPLTCWGHTLSHSFFHVLCFLLLPFSLETQRRRAATALSLLTMTVCAALKRVWSSRSPSTGYPRISSVLTSPSELSAAVCVAVCALLCDLCGVLPGCPSCERSLSAVIILALYLPLTLHGKLSPTVSMSWLVVQGVGHVVQLGKAWDGRRGLHSTVAGQER
jgi:hypothetical protein